MNLSTTNILTLIVLLAACIGCAVGALWLTRERKIVAGSIADHGAKGEQRVNDALSVAGYEVITDLTLPYGGSTHQIDHIVPGSDCLWVLETKTWRGKAVGRPGGRKWTLHRPGNKAPVITYNPLLQNQRHAEIIEKKFRVPVKSLVVSAGALSLSPALTGLVLPLSALTARLGPPGLHTEEVERAFADLMRRKTSWHQKGLADRHRRWMENGWGTSPEVVLFLASLVFLAVSFYKMYVILLGN